MVVPGPTTPAAPGRTPPPRTVNAPNCRAVIPRTSDPGGPPETVNPNYRTFDPSYTPQDSGAKDDGVPKAYEPEPKK